MEDGHLGVEKIYSRKPWIYREDQGGFEERKVTSAGRRSLIKDLERMKRGEETAELPEPAEEKTKQESAEGKTKQKKINMIIKNNPETYRDYFFMSENIIFDFL